jgi:hypothetical protein
MVKNFLVATSLLAAAAVATPASAVTFVTALGSTATFAAPAGTVIDFNGALPSGFTLTGSSYQLATGNTPFISATPGFSDGSRYLSVQAGGLATLQSTAGYLSVSVFVGSIDSFNTVQVLNTLGTVIGTFTGADFTATANGDQSLPSTNRRVTFFANAAESIGGLRFLTSGNSFEVDNVVFAVPEPATWLLMIVGFALVGQSMRVRRGNVRVVYS